MDKSLKTPDHQNDRPLKADIRILTTKLKHSLESLKQRPEFQAHIQATKELKQAQTDYDDNWAAFVDTSEGRHYNQSNQHYQSIKKYYRLAKSKVAQAPYFKTYIAAENQRIKLAQLADQAESQALADPTIYQTDEYHQITQRHRSVLNKSRRAWRDLGHIVEGKNYQRAKLLIESAKREISLARAKASQTPQGQRLKQNQVQVKRFEQKLHQAEKACKQTSSYKQYAKIIASIRAKANELQQIASRQKNQIN